MPVAWIIIEMQIERRSRSDFDLSRLVRLALIFEAIVYLAVARLALLALPFERVARQLGIPTAPDVNICGEAPEMSQPSRSARDIGSAVRRAARFVPFKAACLQQAVAANAMLRRRGIGSALHLGVSQAGGVIEAHAWLDAAGVEITGYPLRCDLSELVCFRWAAR